MCLGGVGFAGNHLINSFYWPLHCPDGTWSREMPVSKFPETAIYLTQNTALVSNMIPNFGPGIDPSESISVAMRSSCGACILRLIRGAIDNRPERRSWTLSEYMCMHNEQKNKAKRTLKGRPLGSTGMRTWNLSLPISPGAYDHACILPSGFIYAYM